jgi:hypothetical protein
LGGAQGPIRVFLLSSPGAGTKLKGSARSFPSVRLRTRCQWQLCTRCGRRRSALEIAIDPFQGFFTVPSHFNSMRRNGAVPNGVGGVFFA